MLVKKMNVTHIYFAMSYALFVFNLFNRDVSDISVFHFMTGVAKYLSLLVLILYLINSRICQKKRVMLLVVLGISLLLTVMSRSLFFIIDVLLVYCALKVDDKFIIKTAFVVLITLLILTICMSFVGVFDDIITNRFLGTSDRHSFGFYHSNVIPLILFYLVCYYSLLETKRMTMYQLLFFAFMDFVVYWLCGSRNSFIAVLFVVFVKYIDGKINKLELRNTLNKGLEIIGKYIFLFLSIVSVTLPYVITTSSVLQKIDYLLSYRFTLTKMKIDSLGFGMINHITNEQYFNDGIIVDNGYAFVAIRYGLVVLVLLSFIVYTLAKKNNNNIVVLSVIIAVSLVNLIDNDIFDYLCLPFLIIGLKSVIDQYSRTIKLEENIKSKEKELDGVYE